MKLGKILIVTTLAVSLLTTSLAFAATPKSTEARGNTVTAQETTIGSAKAKSIFWKKVPKSTIKYIKLTTDRDDGRVYKIYKGKAVKGDYVYSFEIDAYTGKFRDYERDLEKSRSTASKIGSSISKTDVINKVRSRVSKAVIIYVKLTKDDGRWIYEGEAYRNGYEYSFEMNAYSGKFIEWEKDWAFD